MSAVARRLYAAARRHRQRAAAAAGIGDYRLERRERGLAAECCRIAFEIENPTLAGRVRMIYEDGEICAVVTLFDDDRVGVGRVASTPLVELHGDIEWRLSDEWEQGK